MLLSVFGPWRKPPEKVETSHRRGPVWGLTAAERLEGEKLDLMLEGLGSFDALV
jgi:hypothetical protein